LQTVPAVNQVEFHPYLVQQDLLDYCHAKGRLTCTLTFVCCTHHSRVRLAGIVVTAYSPLGSSDSYTGKMEGAPSLLKSELVNDIANAVGRSPAQVLIRWAVQKGVVVRITPLFPPRTCDGLIACPLSHTS
jgi:D-xylose reductase